MKQNFLKIEFYIQKKEEEELLNWSRSHMDFYEIPYEHKQLQLIIMTSLTLTHTHTHVNCAASSIIHLKSFRENSSLANKKVQELV